MAHKVSPELLANFLEEFRCSSISLYNLPEVVCAKSCPLISLPQVPNLCSIPKNIHCNIAMENKELASQSHLQNTEEQSLACNTDFYEPQNDGETTDISLGNFPRIRPSEPQSLQNQRSEVKYSVLAQTSKLTDIVSSAHQLSCPDIILENEVDNYSINSKLNVSSNSNILNITASISKIQNQENEDNSLCDRPNKKANDSLHTKNVNRNGDNIHSKEEEHVPGTETPFKEDYQERKSSSSADLNSSLLPNSIQLTSKDTEADQIGRLSEEEPWRDIDEDPFPSLVSSDSGVFAPVCGSDSPPCGSDSQFWSNGFPHCVAHPHSSEVLCHRSAVDRIETSSFSESEELESLQSELLLSLTESSETFPYNSPLTGRIPQNNHRRVGKNTESVPKTVHFNSTLTRCSTDEVDSTDPVEFLRGSNESLTSLNCTEVFDLSNQSFDTSFTERIMANTAPKESDIEENILVVSTSTAAVSRRDTAASESHGKKPQFSPKLTDTKNNIHAVKVSDYSLEFEKIDNATHLSTDLKTAIKKALQREKDIEQLSEIGGYEKYDEMESDSFTSFHSLKHNSLRQSLLNHAKIKEKTKTEEKNSSESLRNMSLSKNMSENNCNIELATEATECEEIQSNNPVEKKLAKETNNPIQNLKLHLDNKNKKNNEYKVSEQSSLLSDYLRISNRISSLLTDVKSMSKETKAFKKDYSSLQTRTNNISDRRDELVKMKDKLLNTK